MQNEEFWPGVLWILLGGEKEEIEKRFRYEIRAVKANLYCTVVRQRVGCGTAEMAQAVGVWYTKTE